MKNLYRWLIIILNASAFMFITNKLVHRMVYLKTFTFNDFFIGISLVTVFALNTCYILCSGSGWLHLYLKRKKLEEKKRIEEFLQKEINNNSYICKILRFLLVVGNIIGLIFLIYDYYSANIDSYAAKIFFLVYITLFLANIYYVLYNRIDDPCWLSLVIKRKKLEEEKKIEELER